MACTIVAVVLLQHHVGKVYLRACGGSTEVENEHHLIHVEAFEIVFVERVGIASHKVDTLFEEEQAVVAILNELHGGALHLLCGGKLSREVVVVGSIGSHVGMELHLCLPLVLRCIGQGNGVFATTFVVKAYGVRVRGPAVGIGIVELCGVCHRDRKSVV